MEDSDIVDGVLLQLDGWVLDIPENDNIMEYNKKITEDEILEYFNVARDYAESYTKLSENELFSEAVNRTAVVMWTAGLLWNKYNIRTNNQLDETNTLGYGDKLVVQAKEMLKPSKSYEFYAW